MPTAHLTILKIGGSVISHKKQDGSFRHLAVKRLGREIKKALKDGARSLILVHGAGGRGHRIARKYSLQKDALSKKAVFGALATHGVVSGLQKKIAEIFRQEGLPVFPMQTNVFFYRNRGGLIFANTGFVEKIITRGWIPLFYGDMVYDDRKNFSILSGDVIALRCAERYRAQKILFASDVNGVYTDDPHQNKSSRLLARLDHKALAGIVSKKHARIDTTGAMSGKLSCILSQRPEADVVIYNGLAEGSTYRALVGQTVGTLIEAFK